MKSSLPTCRQAQILNALVATLSTSLDLDAGQLIPELREAEVARNASASASGEMEDQAAGDMVVEEMEDVEEEEGDGQRRNGKATQKDNDFSDLLPVSVVLPF